MRIKSGDKVRVIAGKDKGQEGIVLETQPKAERVIVDGVNIIKKHTKASQFAQGGIEEVPGPIHVSNVMLIDPNTNEPTRVGYREEDGKKVRYSKKSGQTIN